MIQTIAALATTNLANELCSFIDESGLDLISTPIEMCRRGYGNLQVTAAYWYDDCMFDILDQGFLFYN